MSAYVGSSKNLKDLKGEGAARGTAADPLQDSLLLGVAAIYSWSYVPLIDGRNGSVLPDTQLPSGLVELRSCRSFRFFELPA